MLTYLQTDQVLCPPGLRVNDLMCEANININTASINHVTIPEIPPWELHCPYYFMV